MIIIEILYTFDYLHLNKFIYRDLKPDNLIIDQNYNLVLIDFDRMITNNHNDELVFTADLNSPFLAPELKVKNYVPSFENDIYSIGRIIYYIFTGDKNFIIDELQQKYPAIFDILKQCCNENPNERPSILDLINFFDTFIFKIDNTSFIRNIEINI